MTVYFAKARGHDLFKIGYTSGTPEDRIAQLQVGCPYRLHCYASLRGAEGTRCTEAKIHEELDPHRRRGEWFELTEERVQSLLRSYGIEQRFEDIELETGAYLRLDLKTNKLYVAVDSLAIPDWQQVVYLGTADVIVNLSEKRVYINVKELIQDYPDTRNSWFDLIDRTWPDRKHMIKALVILER